MAASPSFKEKYLKVRSYRGEYEVRFVDDFAPVLESELIASDVLVVDENVSIAHAKRVQPLLQRFQHIIISPTEEQKSYLEVAPVINDLIRNGFRKNHRLIAIGGGITQDVTAFIASILYRGVQWIFIPTNLLSQCDSCIGSKTSINFGTLKNQIGTFHPPVLVLNDLSFLESLPREQFRSGMGEMLHYYLLSGQEDFERMEREYDSAFTDRDILSALVRRSLEIKKTQVEIDEFDQGSRRIFNYGHTFGHAIESHTNFAIPHGIAVTFGMDIANNLSVALGFLKVDKCQEMRSLLERNWKPSRIGAVDIDSYLAILRQDKKNVDESVRVVLTSGLGNMFLFAVEIDDCFRETLATCFEYYDR